MSSSTSSEPEPQVYKPQPRRIFSGVAPLSTSVESLQESSLSSPQSQQSEPSSAVEDLKTVLNDTRAFGGGSFGGHGADTPSHPPPYSPSRNRSVLNLTASTLFGIYAPDDDASLFGVTPMHTGGATTPSGYPPTPRFGGSSSNPWPGAGASNPYPTSQTDRMAPVIGALERPTFRSQPTALSRAPPAAGSPTWVRVLRGLVRAALLFGLGVAYGVVITHLHDARDLAPVKLDTLDRGGTAYMIFWGVAGILLGTALPIFDAIWEGEGPEEKRERVMTAAAAAATPGASGSRSMMKGGAESPSASASAYGGAGRGSKATAPVPPAARDDDDSSTLGAEWNPVVRSIGAFVGIGFAIRRLPWQSTLQASATLGLANPCLWYMIDRTFPGFLLSTLVGVLGTTVLLGTEIVPLPAVVRSDLGGAAAAAAAAGLNGSHHVPGATPAATAGGHGAAAAAAGLLSEEQQGTFAVWIWIASVLFCSCVCFGNIGRRLAV